MTDHESLKELMKQKNLSPRQARWVEELNNYDFEIGYIPAAENKFADALSRIYDNEAPGTVRSRSEFVSELQETNNLVSLRAIELRAGEPKTVDTGPAVFHRLGLTGRPVKPVEVKRNDERGSRKGKKAKVETKADHSSKGKTTSEEKGSLGNEIAEYDPIADPSKGSENDEMSDASTDIVPAEFMPTTRSGRAVKPSKRKDHDFEKLYVRKRKSSDNVAETKKNEIHKPLTIKLKLGKRKE
ncbi:hypothetical protein FRC01_012020, partial [Tulasnella sp. 417]